MHGNAVGLRNRVEHGEHRLCSLVALLATGAGARLLDGLAGQDAEADRDVEIDRDALKRVGHGIADVAVVRRFTGDDAAERNNGVERSAVRDPRGEEGNLKGAGCGERGEVVRPAARIREGSGGAALKRCRDLRVIPAHNERDAQMFGRVRWLDFRGFMHTGVDRRTRGTAPPRVDAISNTIAHVKAWISQILAAVQLTRLTMAFGAVSDVWLVILMSRALHEGERGAPVIGMSLWLALFSGAIVAIGLFAYGASLNDVLDARHDSAFSPDRPIPSGRIRVSQAIIVTVGALLIAVLGGQAMGTWALQLTLLTAVGILFFNAAGKFIPAVGMVVIGLVHAIHMLIPNVALTFTWPVWFVMTHAVCVATAAYTFEGKRPRITPRAFAAIACGWFFWSIVILGWGITRGGWWPEDRSPLGILWPVLAAVVFLVVARWKTTGVPGPVAAEKLIRYGAMWQALYGAMWLFALGLSGPGIGLALFAVFGFTLMTILKEAMGQMSRPLTWRV